VNRVIIATFVTGGENLNGIKHVECIAQAGHMVINSGGEHDFQKVYMTERMDYLLYG